MRDRTTIVASNRKRVNADGMIIICREALTAKAPCLPSNFFHAFFSSADFFQNTTRVSKSFDADQTLCSIGHDLGPNCLQRLSADDTSRQRNK